MARPYFEYIRTLNVGEFGESLVARKTNTGQVYTVKLVRKGGYNADKLVVRIRGEQKISRVLTGCNVPFVTRLYWSFEDERAMYLVIDWTDDRSLRSVVQNHGPLLPHEAVICAAELAEGITGLHAHGIVHTNLRPESVLIGEDGHVIVSDLDSAVFLYDDAERYLRPRTRRSASAREYKAPELMLGWEYDYAVDWWSFGLLLYWAMTGTHPFANSADVDHPEIVRSKILHANLTDDRLGMDESAYQLIYRCLQRNPALRIDGLGVKKHEYFDGA
ncbi:kinase-like domain-containing protein [Trametes meyenii]|nr:kinase-like domain-containing protein [Trametes meyenii]